MFGTLTLLLAAFVAPAWAQSDDDDFDLDDDIDISEEPAPKPVPTTPPPPPADPTDKPPDDDDDKDGGLEDFRDDEDGTDLLGEEATVTSSDTETVYRQTQTRLQKLDADEELAGWEAYLAQYPDSAYRVRIENRMEELTNTMYATGINTGPNTVDALTAELPFAHGMQLENLNPRTRLMAGFEWGYPDYMNLMADYERAFKRNLSVHVGLRRRYQGWNLETGVRYALVKSTRTNTILSLLGDLHFNTNPAFPGIRPQLAFGKKLGNLDAQVQAGVDLEFRNWVDANDERASGLQPRYVGGLNLTYMLNERVGAFGEGYLHFKSLAADGAFTGGLYQFHVVTFGLKIFPGSESKNLESNFGTTVPVSQQYYQFHYGSVMGQFNYYL